MKELYIRFIQKGFKFIWNCFFFFWKMFSKDH